MAGYKLYEIDNREQWGVEITSGPYSGVSVYINQVGIEEDDQGAMLKVDYDVINNPNNIEFGEDWNVELGETVQALIADSISHSKAKEQLNDLQDS